MGAISVRDLDDEVTARLKVRAARHGRSMEAEVRAILSEALAGGPDRPNLAQAIRERFADLHDNGGEVDGLTIPPRREMPRAADLPG